ncbi:glycerol-3-phosphate dehydrogenase [Paenirhodobacter populi]|uniref:Glycerol-3-phosphate dehydrogenase n=1 Tax=Paenirhodobacter populi TaxID=2306993 RepID=A0A443IZH0_9RHOB|nr:glycerol-3-phosphate dehydrogenase [Sinirhodobacter populi]RWR13705.1 glycerol-3-phosphate dehydrogenase [Sinirhodobacter populi]
MADTQASQAGTAEHPADLFIIGGGINGCGIARDAAGRGLSVLLCEKGDLAQATSSASTKLFHGGLRYLEYLEIRLVREALEEREILLRANPHISRPMRFVLPMDPSMRFPTNTPVGRMLPFLKGRRPAAVIRAGLFLYDHLGGRKLLPGTRRLDLRRDPAGAALRGDLRLAYEYSDGWVDDARLVVLNARDAAARGARIMTRTQVTAAHREDGLWRIETTAGTFRARALVNAAGPWVGEVIRDTIHVPSKEGVRLVRGSHIVTRRLFDHDRAYFFQGPDGRICFAIPYEQDFTLIGTTDNDYHGDPAAVACTPEEQRYLCDFVSRYFARPVTPADVVWTYSGVRPLYDDGARSATAATRDYVLRLDDGGAPLLNIFGGKITTYRRLAEHALEKLGRFFPQATAAWTADVALPGGAFPVGGGADLAQGLTRDYPFLTPAWAARLIRTYGTEARLWLGDAARAADLGQDFGATLTAAEIRWQIDREWARSGKDVLWRRTKIGLHLDAAARAAVGDFVAAELAGQAVAGPARRASSGSLG